MSEWTPNDVAGLVLMTALCIGALMYLNAILKGD